MASVGLIVGRQAHPSFGSKFIVSLVEPQPDARTRSPMVKATSNDGDQAASQISGTHPFSVSGGYPLHCRPLNNEPAFLAATLPAVRPGIRSMRPGDITPPANVGIELSVANAARSSSPTWSHLMHSMQLETCSSSARA